MNKKYQLISLICMAWVVLFFVIFLHPLFAVRVFKVGTYGIFRFLSGVTSLVMLVGGGLYGYILYIAIKTKQLARPVLWLQLPLLVVSSIMTAMFLIPITLSA